MHPVAIGEKNMVSFEYTITNPSGIHARPAGDISRAAQSYDSMITMTNEKGDSCPLDHLLSLLLLGVKCGEKVIVSAEGSDEEKAIEKLRRFFEEKL